MAKSSIHIAVGNVSFIIHSTRNNFSYSVVFTDEKNEHLRNAKEALKIYREELAKRSLAYSKATGQKLQKNVAIILSAVVNLEQHHTLQDLQPILDKLEKDLDTKIISCSIHRDEGTLIEKSTGKKYFSGEDFALNKKDGKLYWIDQKKNFLEPINLEQFEIKKNYHAHLEFLGIDSQGKAIKRNRLNRHYLSNLQTFVANTLGMERGKRLSKNRHKDPHEFKKIGVAKREAQEELEKKATIKALKEINKQIRAQLQEKKAQRPHYAKWEAYYKELREYVKSEKPTIGKVMERIGDFVGELLEEIENTNKQIQGKDEEIEQLQKINNSLSRHLLDTQKENAQLKQQIQQLQNALAPAPKVVTKEVEKIVYREDTYKIEKLKKELEEEKRKNREFYELLQKREQEIVWLKEQLQELKQLRYRERKEREEEIKELKELIKELEKEWAKTKTSELERKIARMQELDKLLEDFNREDWDELEKEWRTLYEELENTGIRFIGKKQEQKPKKKHTKKNIDIYAKSVKKAV